MTPSGARDRAQTWRIAALQDTLFLRADFRCQRFDRHYHEEYAIGVIDGGCQAFVYDQGRRLDMPGGSVALISPGVVHSGGPGDVNGWRYRMLYPPAGLVAGLVADMFGAGAAPSFHRPVVWDGELYWLLSRLHAESSSPDPDGMAIETLLLSTVRLSFERYAGLPAPAAVAANATLMAQARDLLEARFAEAVTLSELASLAALSRFQVLRQFKAAFGLPPHAYLRQIRVRRAREAILAGAALADTAAAVGFADQSHMTRAFRRTLGYTPSVLARA